MIYKGYKVYGPYKRKQDNYQHVILQNTQGHKITVSYARYLLERKIDRLLKEDEEAHHIDKNPLNNCLDNLEIKNKSDHRRDHVLKYIKNIKVNCIWCNKEFELTPTQQSTRTCEARRMKNGPYCSKRCSGMASHYI